MNNKALTLSLVMAVLAVFFVQSYVTSIEEDTKKKFGTEVLVVSAKKDINEMETIDETMLELKKIPKRFLEPVAVSFERSDQDDVSLRDMKRLAGSVAMVPIKSGEQITYNKITEPSLRTGLAPQITPGRRAVTIPVDEVSSVAKLVKPGDRVDLIGIIDLGGGSGGKNTTKMSKTILQDVGILAVGRSVTNNVARLLELDKNNGKLKTRSLVDNDTFSSVTLEVEPYQAQMISLMIATGGQLSLTLRNNDDTDRVALGGMTLGDILGVEASRFAQPVPTAPRTPAATQQMGGNPQGGAR